MLKVVTAKVKINNHTVDGYKDNNGNSYLSCSGMARLVGLHSDAASPCRMSKTLLKGLPTSFEFIKANGVAPVTLWAVEHAMYFLKYYASKGNPHAAKLLNQSIIKKGHNLTEKGLQLQLQEKLGGETEVPTLVGYIDLLTDDLVIEIKKVKDWKSALGQVLSYGYYYPNHNLQLYLFGKVDTTMKETISAICNQHSVKVIFH